MSLSRENSNQSPHQAPPKNYQRLSPHEFDQFIKDVNASINAESLSKDLLGQQNFNSNMSNSERLHFGRKGSLVVNSSGEYAGRFKDFESGEQGNLIQLVQREKGLNFKSALSYVSPYINSLTLVQKIDDFTQGKNITEREEDKIPLRDRETIDQEIQDLEKKISNVEVENEPLLERWEEKVKEASRVEGETGVPQGILHSTSPGQDFIDIYRAEISELEAERALLMEKTKSPETLAKEREAQIEKERSQKTEAAKDIISKTVPIAGTPAESYLKNERGIQGELPESLRYLPAGSKFNYNGKDSYVRDGALAAVAKDSNGSPKAVQVTYLTKEGKRAETPDCEKFPKITYGSLKGASVQLQVGDKGSPVIIAEGVETALSLKETGVKGDIVCSLGTSNMKNLDLQNRDVIIAGDWDGSFEKPSWEATEKAKSALANKGNKVEIILPVKNPKLTNEKVDFNDILRKDGISSVVDRLKSTQQEKKHEQTQNIYANKDSTDGAKHDTSASPSQEQKRSLLEVGQKVSSEPIGSKRFQEKTKTPSISMKHNPFKTNPFDVKSCANDGFGRGR